MIPHYKTSCQKITLYPQDDTLTKFISRHTQCPFCFTKFSNFYDIVCPQCKYHISFYNYKEGIVSLQYQDKIFSFHNNQVFLRYYQRQIKFALVPALCNINDLQTILNKISLLTAHHLL